MTTYLDVAASGGSPLLHFLQFGKHEGRQPTGRSASLAEIIDASSEDLKPWFAPLDAYAAFDAHQQPTLDLAARIAASGLFDATYYLDQNQDVATAGVDPLEHYLIAGALKRGTPTHSSTAPFTCVATGTSTIEPESTSSLHQPW